MLNDQPFARSSHSCATNLWSMRAHAPYSQVYSRSSAARPFKDDVLAKFRTVSSCMKVGTITAFLVSANLYICRLQCQSILQVQFNSLD